MRRIVSVWLVDWPVTVWSRTAGRSPPPDGAPFALVERTPRGLALRALNPAARAAGLRRGQAHADARAILPRLLTAPAEPEAERRQLHALCLWGERWTPMVAPDGAVAGLEGLFLDVTGATHLFGGEARLARALGAALARMAVPARLAFADTPGAAWGLARFGAEGPCLLPSCRTLRLRPGEPCSGLHDAALRQGAVPAEPQTPEHVGASPARTFPRHPRESGDPCAERSRQEPQRQPAWIPAFAGMTITGSKGTGTERVRGGDSGKIPSFCRDAPLPTRDAIAPLPLAALRLDEATLALARRLGLRTIGDLYAMPRHGLARRFRGGDGKDGLALVRRLDQALGVEPEPLDPFRPPPRYRIVHRFAEPVGDMAGVAHHLAALAPPLAAALAADGMGARALSLAGFRTDGAVTTLDVRLGRPTRSIALWTRLLRTRGLDRLDLGFGIDALGLAAPEAEPLAPGQPGLDGADAREEALGEVVDRLAARLGDGAVRRAVPHASWLPERATRWRAIEGTSATPDRTLDRARPLLLLDPPEPVEAGPFLVPDGAPRAFRWRRVLRRVARAEGPERLAPEWWRAPSRAYGGRTRDYYRIEDEAGLRYWLYREGLPERDAAPPGWWMHGLFA